MRVLRLAVLSVVVMAACSKPTPAPDPQFVAQWMRSSLAFTRSERLGPPVAARISALAAIALYEGYASAPASTLRSLAGQLNALDSLPAVPAGGAIDGAIVAAEAERVVLDSLYRDGFASTRRTVDSLAAAQAAARVAVGISESTRDRSIAHGRRLGAAILGWAATDGFYATRSKVWTPPKVRSKWVNTNTPDQFVPLTLSGESDLVRPANPNVQLELERAGERFVFTNRPRAAGATSLPTFNPVKPTEPFWGELRPFTIKDGDECRPAPPPAYSERPGTPFYAMAREFYDSVRAVTPAQKEIALFWADNPVATGTPAFHWVSVLQQMVERRHLTAEQSAEAFALTTMAMHDAFIGCWKEKFRSEVVRPVTYVQRVWDPRYQTVFPTPPFPEYSSGHSVISGAAVEVLRGVLGDTIPFVDSTQVDIGHPPRAFANFTAARNEVAMSRVYGGIHYMRAVVDGVKQGQCIGQRVLTRVHVRKRE